LLFRIIKSFILIIEGKRELVYFVDGEMLKDGREGKCYLKRVMVDLRLKAALPCIFMASAN